MRDKVRTFIFCLVAVSLNYIVAYLFCDMLHVPLFMDTIFTVAITFYAGLLPGLVVAVSFNIVSSLSSVARGYSFDPFTVLFGICGALIAFVTWFFARKKDEFRISLPVTLAYLVLIAIISSLCSILSSGLIDFLRYSLLDIPDRLAPIKSFTDSFTNMHFSLLVACILGQIPISMLDRLITTFLGYGVYRLLVISFGEEK